MSDALPLGIRVMSSLGKEPDWSEMTTDELMAFRDRENRRRSSKLARIITGRPDSGVSIEWSEVALPDRILRVRVQRPSRTGVEQSRSGVDLPLVIHVHGGGFVGTAVQSDWINSRLASAIPSVVVSVEHRLLAPGTSLTEVVDDGWDVLTQVVERASRWGIDPTRVAVVGESTGALVAALAAIRARDTGLRLRAQVLVNPVVDLTKSMFDHPSVREFAQSPTLTLAQMTLFSRLAAPPGVDARAMSPLLADDLSDLAPALVVVPVHDPAADHGRAYAAQLASAGTQVALAEHPGATHAFLSMPGVVPQAKAARSQIVEFLTTQFTSP